MKFGLLFLGGGLLAVGTYMTLTRRDRSSHAARHVDRRVARKLPTEKHLPTIDDRDGNYDIDGVSFDSSGVVVSSDQQTAPAP